MRLLTGEDGCLISYFDEMDETQIGTQGSTLNRGPVDNHENVDKRGKV